jgi:hypothetical protein
LVLLENPEGVLGADGEVVVERRRRWSPEHKAALLAETDNSRSTLAAGTDPRAPNLLFAIRVGTSGSAGRRTAREPKAARHLPNSLNSGTDEIVAFESPGFSSRDAAADLAAFLQHVS